MAWRRAVLLVAVIALAASVAPAVARDHDSGSDGNGGGWWNPHRTPRISPILDCVTIDLVHKTYTAYFGYENQDGVPQNYTVGDDNCITGFGQNYNNRLPTFFRLWNLIPNRPGRSPPFPNSPFSITLPLFSIGIWRLCGRFLIITQFGPPCSAPDLTPPVFTVPSSCPATYNVNALSGSVKGNFTQCFAAVDNDAAGGVTITNSFESVGADACLNNFQFNGLGPHAGTVSAMDRSGNTAVCAITVNVLDKEAPKVTCPANVVVSITDPTASTYTLTSSSANQVTATDNNPAATFTYSYKVSGVTTIGATAGQNANGVFNKGVSTVTFTVSDSGTPGVPSCAVNTATCTFTVTVNDGAPPQITCPLPPIGGQDKSPNANTYSTKAKALGIFSKVTLTATINGVQTATGTATAANTAVTVDGSATYNFPVGTTTVTFTATNPTNGKTSQCTISVVITPQPNAKMTSCPASQSFNTGNLANSGAQTIAPAVANGAIVSLICPPAGTTVTLTNNANPPTCAAAGGTATQCSGGCIGGGADVSGTYPVGVTTITFTALPLGAGGSPASCPGGSITITVTDNVSPSLACPTDVGTVGTDAGKSFYTLPVPYVATASDNVIVTLSNDFGTAKATAAAGAQATLGLGSTTTLAVNTVLTVNWKASDGITAHDQTCARTITVKDLEAPKATCPGNLVLTTDAGSPTATVSSPGATATDNVAVTSFTNNAASFGLSVDATTGAISGQLAAAGSPYTITYNANDAGNNANAGSSCSFTITVSNRAYCTSNPCNHGGVCKVTTTTFNGVTGIPVGQSCDCSATGCWANFQAGTASAAVCGLTTDAIPFPTFAAGAVSLAECSTNSFTIQAEPGNFPTVASCAFTTSGVTRAWSVISSSGFTSDLTAAIAAANSASPVATSLTVNAAWFSAGSSVTIRSQYSFGTQTTAYDTVVTKSTDAIPTFTISGPTSDATNPITSTANIVLSPAGLTLCGGAAVTNPKYLWSSPDVPASAVAQSNGAADYIDQTFTILVNQLGSVTGAVYNVFLTITDQFGVNGTAGPFQIFLTTSGGSAPPPVCHIDGTQNPRFDYISITDTVTQRTTTVQLYSDDTNNGVPPPTDGSVTCGTEPADGFPEEPDCVIPQVSLRPDHTYTITVNGLDGDSDPFYDDRFACVGDPAPTFQWTIYESVANGGAAYQGAQQVDPQGSITLSSDSHTLTIGTDGLPSQSDPTGGTDPLATYWRVRVVITSGCGQVGQDCTLSDGSAGIAGTGPDQRWFSTARWFSFDYPNSQLDISLSSTCTPNQAVETACDISAAPTGGGGSGSAHGFTTQDTFTYTWAWTINPPVAGLTLPTGATFSVPAGLDAGTLYTVTCVATRSDGVKGTTATSFFIVDNQLRSVAPADSQFTVSPSTGSALTSQFSLISAGWIAGQPVQYRYTYKATGSSDAETPLTASSYSSTSTAYLPAGTFTIYAYINSGSNQVVRTAQVTVTAAESNMCFVLSVADGVLTTAENSNDRVTMLQLIGGLAQTLADPALQTSASVQCNGNDVTTEVQNLRQRFLAMLNVIAGVPMDATTSAMVTNAMAQVVANVKTSPITTNEATNTAAMLQTVITGMGQTGATASSGTQSNVIQLVSNLVSMVTDCSTLDALAQTMRQMFVQGNQQGLAGSTSISMSAPNVQFASQTVWANVPQSASLGDVAFNFPAAALKVVGATDLNINMINYVDQKIKSCRNRDVYGNTVSIISDIFSVEVVNAKNNLVQSVSGLASPVTFTMPLTNAVLAKVTDKCGVATGPLQCAYWDSNYNGWSPAGMATTGTSLKFTDGLKGVSCSSSHLTEFAVIRVDIQCTSAKVIEGFKASTFIYIGLLACALGVLFRTLRHSGTALRENLLFTSMAAVACIIRLVLSMHFAESYYQLPMGVPEVLSVIPFSILYWINGHFFAQVRKQRIESTEARVRWRVEPLLTFIQVCVFLGVLVLLAGIGLDYSSQSKLAMATERIIAVAFSIANLIFFGYSLTIIAGFTAGRSDQNLTRSLTVMSLASIVQSCAWIGYPIDGYYLYFSCLCDLVGILVLFYRYRNPLESEAWQKRMSDKPLTDEDAHRSSEMVADSA